MYVYACVHVCTCVYACERVCARARAYMRVYMRVYACMCVSVCTYVDYYKNVTSPIDYRVQFKFRIHTYEAIRGQSPGNTPDTLNVFRPRRTLRFMESMTLVVQWARTVAYGDGRFWCSVDRFWNGLPTHILEAEARDTQHFNETTSYQFRAHVGASRNMQP